RKRAYCLKIQPATGSFARNLIYSTKPNGFVNEVFDISVAKIAYVGWTFSILFSIPFFVIASYFSCMAIGAVTDSSRVKRIKIPSMVHTSILCLSGVFFNYRLYFLFH
ncbi:hypothetical protein J5D75_21965, partial [Klebsiella pneumoniae subsp. pneumoniae]|nr:hypothetical protein [Klebsiella pneumoniae subsp. pneumoniae]